MKRTKTTFWVNKDKLLSLRTAKSWTLKDLAKECEVDLNHYHKLELGKIKKATPRFLNKIAKGFGIEPSRLIQEEDFKKATVVFPEAKESLSVIKKIVDSIAQKTGGDAVGMWKETWGMLEELVKAVASGSTSRFDIDIKKFSKDYFYRRNKEIGGQMNDIIQANYIINNIVNKIVDEMIIEIREVLKKEVREKIYTQLTTEQNQ